MSLVSGWGWANGESEEAWRRGRRTRGGRSGLSYSHSWSGSAPWRSWASGPHGSGSTCAAVVDHADGPPSAGQGDVTQEKLTEAVDIIRNRVSAIAEAEVTTQGSDHIIVEVPGVGQDEIVRLVGSTAELRFRQVLAVQQAGAAAPAPRSRPHRRVARRRRRGRASLRVPTRVPTTRRPRRTAAARCRPPGRTLAHADSNPVARVDASTRARQDPGLHHGRDPGAAGRAAEVLLQGLHPRQGQSRCAAVHLRPRGGHEVRARAGTRPRVRDRGRVGRDPPERAHLAGEPAAQGQRPEQVRQGHQPAVPAAARSASSRSCSTAR